tara:strand:+ start:474 stop:662 length:189 start_codon:yes stop_codon:yes gene_type:complete
VLLHALRLGFVLTARLVLRITQAGTGDVCLVFLSSLIFLADVLRVAIKIRHVSLFLNQTSIS